MHMAVFRYSYNMHLLSTCHLCVRNIVVVPGNTQREAQALWWTETQTSDFTRSSQGLKRAEGVLGSRIKTVKEK